MKKIFVKKGKISEVINDIVDELGNDYKKVKFKDCKVLLDYITNLQQENEYLKLSNPEMNIEHFRVINENKRKINNLRKQNKDLQQENERLKKDVELFKSDLISSTNTGLSLITKIDKAIEYINNHKIEWTDENFEVDNEMVAFNEYANPQALLNILQNGSDDIE